MSDPETIASELPSPSSNGKPEEREAKAGTKDRGGRKSPTVAADGSTCPFCEKAWDDHNLVAVRECMPKLEEALRLAERARIRASLK